MERPPGQLAVPDIAPTRGAHPPRFPRRIGGKVVVQHEILAVLPFERVDDLLVLTGPERRYRERLGLASGEQCRAVSAAKDSDLARNWPDGAGIATINPRSAPQHSATDDLLLEILEQLQRNPALKLIRKYLGQLCLRRIQPIAPLLLALLAIGILDQRPDRIAQPRLDRGRLERFVRQAPRLARAGLGELDDRLKHRLKFAMSEDHRAEH